MPPHNIEAERQLLGALMLDGPAMNHVAGLVSEDDFFRASHAAVFAAVRDLYDRGQRCDVLSVEEELKRSGRLASVGTWRDLAELVESAPHAGLVVEHAHVVRGKAVKRRLIDAAGEILRDCYADALTTEELTTRAEEAVFAVSDAAAAPREQATLSQASSDALGGIEARQRGDVLGLRTGVPELDSITDGLHPGQVVVLAARPGQGKTALALSVADHAATDLSAPTLFVSLEMCRQELGERYLSMRGRVDGHKLKNPEALTDGDWAAIGRAHDDAARSRLVIDDTPGLNMTQVGASARRVKARHGLALVVVDYLQLVDGPRQRGESREQEVARVSRRLKTLARELKVPVLVLAQLNRQAESRDGHRPRLSDLRESGQIEQDADAVLLLHRPDVYDPNDRPGEADLIVAKNRNGRTGTVRLVFHRHMTRFEGYAPDPGVAGPEF